MARASALSRTSHPNVLRPVELVALFGFAFAILTAWGYGRKFYFIFGETVQIAMLPLLWFLPGFLAGHLMRLAGAGKKGMTRFYRCYLAALVPLYFGGVLCEMAFHISFFPRMGKLMDGLFTVNAVLAYFAVAAIPIALKARRRATVGILRRESIAIARGARLSLCLLLCLIAYSNLKTMIPLIRPGQYDDWLYRIDRGIFLNGRPFRWLTGLPIAGLPDLMVESYLFFFFLLVYGPAGALLFGSGRKLERVVAAYVVAYFIGVAAYFIVPAVGPAFTSKSAFIFDGTRNFEIKRALMSMYRGFLTDPRNAPVVPFEGLASLPSLHVTIGLLSLYYLWFQDRWLAGLLVVPFLLLTVSTLYLGMHHFLDLPAGFLVALMSIAAVDRMYPVAAKAKSPRSLSTAKAPEEGRGRGAEPIFD